MLRQTLIRSSVSYNRNSILCLEKFSGKSFCSYSVKSNTNITYTLNRNTYKYLYKISNKHQRVSYIDLNIIQARHCSSSSFSSVIHKLLHVKAEEPQYSDGKLASTSVEYIPPPPVPPDFTEETVVILNKLGEPTFQSLGLGGWSPVGLFQSFIEYLHVSLDIPWWGAISLVTVLIRICVFPLIIGSQRSIARLNNSMPTIQRFQAKMDEARMMGNQMEYARISYEMQTFMKERNVNPLKNAALPLAQAPIFVSMFIALRRCSNLPVESFKEGGMLWFTDLTVADEFYGLPILTSLTLFATMKMGADGQHLASQKSKVMKYVLMGLPVIVFPFMVNFPTAILCYWTSSNMFSLIQVSFIRIPAVRDFFGIEKLQKNKDDLPKKGVIKGMKDSWSEGKILSEIEARRRVDEMRFRKAGTGPLVKTFKHNPVARKQDVIDVKTKVKG